LYEELAAVLQSPVVELNLAVAVAMADGPAAGLARVEALQPALEGYYLLHATRADLLRRLGRSREAAASYRDALSLVGTDAERRFLARRLAETSEP
jgi:RNA polymerase sigma-70 factor (ECF subfamily)